MASLDERQRRSHRNGLEIAEVKTGKRNDSNKQYQVVSVEVGSGKGKKH